MPRREWDQFDREAEKEARAIQTANTTRVNTVRSSTTRKSKETVPAATNPRRRDYRHV